MLPGRFTVCFGSKICDTLKILKCNARFKPLYVGLRCAFTENIRIITLNLEIIRNFIYSNLDALLYITNIFLMSTVNCTEVLKVIEVSRNCRLSTVFILGVLLKCVLCPVHFEVQSSSKGLKTNLKASLL